MSCGRRAHCGSWAAGCRSRTVCRGCRRCAGSPAEGASGPVPWAAAAAAGGGWGCVGVCSEESRPSEKHYLLENASGTLKGLKKRERKEQLRLNNYKF